MTVSTRQIPLSSPYLDERDEELVLEVLRSGRLSLGPAIERFEQVFAEKVGAPYAAAVSSGTSGLHLLAVIRGLGKGDGTGPDIRSLLARSGEVPTGRPGVRTYRHDGKAALACASVRECTWAGTPIDGMTVERRSLLPRVPISSSADCRSAWTPSALLPAPGPLPLTAYPPC